MGMLIACRKRRRLNFGYCITVVYSDGETINLFLALRESIQILLDMDA